jgi:hypothetical protein
VPRIARVLVQQASANARDTAEVASGFASTARACRAAARIAFALHEKRERRLALGDQHGMPFDAGLLQHCQHLLLRIAKPL